MIAEIQQGATPKWEELAEALRPDFPLLDDLRETPQDPEWHAEGNVFRHTGMVLEEVYQLLEGPASHLTPDRRLALILGAVFHDIAKPLTTRTQEIQGLERVVAPRHADRGRSHLVYSILNLGLPYSVTQQVLALVGHHHDPIRLIRHDRGAEAYHRLARQVDLELVYFLEIADMKGRICPDLSKQLEMLEMFRMFAEEYEVWKQDDPYLKWRQTLAAALQGESKEWLRFVEAKAILEYEAGLIYTPEEAIARSYEARDGYSHLVLLCGPSGAGKSTWARRHLEDYHVVSLDELRGQVTGKVSNQSANGKVRHLAREKLKEHLRRKESVVWDATNLRRDFRTPLVEIGVRYGAYVTIVAFHSTAEEILAGNNQRERQVPKNVIQKQLRSTEWPYCHEAHEVIFVNSKGHTLSSSTTR